MLFVFDLDDTLINSDGTISFNNLQALKEIKTQKHLIAFASGRIYPEMNKLVNAVPRIIDYFVCSNGAVIYDNHQKKFVEVAFLPVDDIDEIIEFAKQNSYFLFFADLFNYFDADFSYQFYNHTQNKRKIANIKNHLLAKNFFVQASFSRYQKVSMKEFKVIKDKFTDFSATLAGKRYMELSALNVNKYLAVKKIVRWNKFIDNEVYVFGDSLNDLELFENFSHTFAMQNAVSEIKKLASKIIGNNNSDTIANEVSKILLTIKDA